MSTNLRNHLYRLSLIFVVLLFTTIGNTFATQANSTPESLQDAVDKALGYKAVLRPNSSFSQQAKLLAGDKADNDAFGIVTALSDDANTALVGAYHEDDSGTTDNGAAYVFIRSGSTWTQQAKLLANDKATDDWFGFSVSLSIDGNTALIGAYLEDDSGTTRSGAAYVFTRSGSTWTQQAKLLANDKADNEQFGVKVALSDDGNTTLIGAYGESDSGTSGNGAAYVFTRSGNTWTQQAKLLANDKVTEDNFGLSVALASNGNTALIGAPFEDDSGTDNNGAAYIFTRSGSTWTQQAKLLANDKASTDWFAWSASIAGNGDTAIIGANYEDDSGTDTNGAAYIFIRNGTTWTQQAKLLASDKANSDEFGHSVGLSADGNIAAVGTYLKDDSGTTNSGAIYIFGRSGSTWTQQEKLLASDKADEDRLGYALSLSADGKTVLGGAYNESDSGTTNNGAAYIFNNPVLRIDTFGIYRPSNQTYYLRNSNTTGGPDITVQYGYLCSGNPCTYPIVGDWNGDGIDTIGLYDQTTGVFLLRDANVPGAPNYSFVLGNPNDQPMAGRWTSDMAHDGAGVFRPSNGILYLKKNLTTGFSDYFAVMGNPGDVGLAGDWNGDGLDSVGVYRPSQSHFYMTNNNQPSGITFSDLDFLYGDGSQDKPFVGDWTGDGISRPGVFRNGFVMLRNSLTGGAPDLIFLFGGATGDMPLAGKWVAGSQPPNARNVILPGAPFVNPDDAGRAD